MRPGAMPVVQRHAPAPRGDIEAHLQTPPGTGAHRRGPAQAEPAPGAGGQVGRVRQLPAHRIPRRGFDAAVLVDHLPWPRPRIPA